MRSYTDIDLHNINPGSINLPLEHLIKHTFRDFISMECQNYGVLSVSKYVGAYSLDMDRVVQIFWRRDNLFSLLDVTYGTFWGTIRFY